MINWFKKRKAKKKKKNKITTLEDIRKSLPKENDADLFTFEWYDAKTTKVWMPYFRSIHNMLLRQEFDEYNRLLESIDVTKASELTMMSVIRLSAPWKNKVPYWDTYLGKIRVELDSRGEDTDSILLGLKPCVDKEYNED